MAVGRYLYVNRKACRAKKGAIRGGFAPSFLFVPLAFQARGTKRAPRKIEDFSGCSKGVKCRKLRCH
jgi:hypothetical protein